MFFFSTFTPPLISKEYDDGIGPFFPPSVSKALRIRSLGRAFAFVCLYANDTPPLPAGAAARRFDLFFSEAGLLH